jgi:3-oxoadipate enol-lactonase
MGTKRGRTPGGVCYTLRGSGPPVLWLSGYVVPVASFDGVVDELADGFTVVTVDHRGSGESRTPTLLTTTGTMARDAVSVLDHLELDSAHVVGPSLGGMVAQEIAIARPHRVRSLVLCSTTAGGLGAKSPPVGELLTELRRTGARVPGRRVPMRLLGVLHQAAAAASHDATRRLHRIQAPTIVLHGGRDALVPLDNASWLAARIPGARLEIVPDGSHLLVLESAPARSALRSWLDEHHALGPVPRPDAIIRAQVLAEAPYRLLLGQSLPSRRVVRAGLRLVRRPSRGQGPDGA